MISDHRAIDPRTVHDLAPIVLDETGRMRVLPAEFWAATTADERALFGHRHGAYGFPTVELVDWLRDWIGGRTAIEIGAGNGVLADALGIVATDSRQQEQSPWREQYAQMRQPTVPYGPNVVEMHASRAVRHYKPDVVIGSWVTHKYDPRRHAAGGNEVGVDELDVLRHCGEFILIGNDTVHHRSRLWERTQVRAMVYPAWLYSRTSAARGRDFVGVWRGQKRTKVS